MPPIETFNEDIDSSAGVDTMEKPGNRPSSKLQPVALQHRQILTTDQVRAKLQNKKGKQYWRCLEELAETPEFMEFLLDEVPQQTRALTAGLDRRQFLTLAGASLALAGHERVPLAAR